MNRREFSKMAAAGSAALGVSPVILKGNWQGANDRVNVAVIGIRAQGLSHHPEPLARACSHLGIAGRETCIGGEALLLQLF